MSRRPKSSGFSASAPIAAVPTVATAKPAPSDDMPVASAGELVERILQLGINTLSFSRVGAFALAHAGLSAAIVALVHASGHPAVAALVLVAGNVVVIVLETLVVSIQTTRLVLFEFFTRFLTAEGRVFRPLAAPPSISQES